MIRGSCAIHKILLIIIFLNFGIEAEASDPKSTSQIIDSLQNRLENVSGKERVDVLNQLAWEYRGELAIRSIQYGESALELAKVLGYSKGETTALSFLGVAWRNLGNLSKALELYYKALKIAEATADSERVAYSHINIGNIYIYQEKYEKALTSFQLALEKAEPLKNPQILAYIYINTGRVYNELRQFEKALYDYSRALNLREGYSDTRGIATVCYEIGNVLIELGRLREARQFLDRSINLSNKHKFIDELAYGYLNLARVEERSNNLDQAIIYATISLQNAEHVGNLDGIKNASKILATSYQKKNQFKEAFQFQSRYIVSKDSIFNDVSRKRIAELQTDYEIEKERNKYELLRRDKENQVLWRNSLILLLALISALVALLFYRVRERRKVAELLQKRNNELALQKKVADEANTFKSELLGIAAHDLRAPLNSILGFSQLINEMPADKEFVQKHSGFIEASSKRMLRLIDDLLKTSSIDAGKLEIHRVRTDVSAFVEEMTINLAPLAAQKGQTISLKTEPDCIAPIDRERFREIFENLVINAIKYSPYGKSIEVRLTQSVGDSSPENDPTDNNRYILLVIQDEGQGFSETDMKRAFMRFQRLSSRPTGGESSTGLGLYIVKQLVELHNGKVWLQSQGKMKGSVFTVQLPTLSYKSEFYERSRG
ncbi:MAG: tetratricopeptide repeat-containing sensor histidine kinase [Chloroherpetonaceae bacterium]|nr:tetratricopeptide repeat-containing sensor histidine kinase [Chloroherpetonaceae bacterium]